MKNSNLRYCKNHRRVIHDENMRLESRSSRNGTVWAQAMGHVNGHRGEARQRRNNRLPRERNVMSEIPASTSSGSSDVCAICLVGRIHHMNPLLMHNRSFTHESNEHRFDCSVHHRNPRRRSSKATRCACYRVHTRITATALKRKLTSVMFTWLTTATPTSALLSSPSPRTSVGGNKAHCVRSARPISKLCSGMVSYFQG